jgi:hypothetical protein
MIHGGNLKLRERNNYEEINRRPIVSAKDSCPSFFHIKSKGKVHSITSHEGPERE